MIRDLYPEPAKASPEARDALERRLLARFDQLHPQEEMPMMQKKRLLFALVLLAGTGIALRAPAQYAAEVGKKITIHEAWPEGQGPDVQAIVAALGEGTGHPGRVEVRRIVTRDSRNLEISLFATNVPADVEQRLRARFPQLKDARIDVAPVEGQIKTDLAGLIHDKLLQAGNDPVKLEEARREAQAELQKRHPGAHVEVDVNGGKTLFKVIEERKK
jgi:hypothetical protein